MKKLFAIIITKKNWEITDNFLEIDTKELNDKKKELKTLNNNSKIEFVDVEEIFLDKKLFLKVIDLYLKNMKSSWFIDYFDVKNLKYQLEWYNNVYIKYISKNYNSYLKRVKPEIFNTFINKELFFSVITSNIDNANKIKILTFYKETFERINNIKRNILAKLVSNIVVFWWAIWLFFFVMNTLLPKIIPLVWQAWTWVNPVLIWIQHYWIYIIISLILTLWFYIWLFFFNWNTFFKTFKFIKVQYKLYKQINTMQLLLLSLLVNSLSIDKLKLVISQTFDLQVETLKWNNFNEILDDILNNSEKLSLFMPEYILTLKSLDTTDFNSYLANISDEIKNLDEMIEESKETFLWFVKSIIFFFSTWIAFMGIFSVILVMNSIIGWAQHLLNS